MPSKRIFRLPSGFLILIDRSVCLVISKPAFSRVLTTSCRFWIFPLLICSAIAVPICCFISLTFSGKFWLFKVFMAVQHFLRSLRAKHPQPQTLHQPHLGLGLFRFQHAKRFGLLLNFPDGRGQLPLHLDELVRQRL